MQEKGEIRIIRIFFSMFLSTQYRWRNTVCWLLLVVGVSAVVKTWPPSSLGVNHMSQYGLAPRAFFASTCHRFACKIFGGVGPTGQKTNDDFFGYLYQFPINRSKSNSLYQKQIPPGAPSARSGAAMVTLRFDGNVYAFLYGGTTTDEFPSSDAYMYDFRSDIWFVVVQPPWKLTLSLHSMVTIGNVITLFFGASSLYGLSKYVFAGRMNLETMTMETLDYISTTGTMYNTTSKQFVQPSGRLSSCCVAHPDLWLTVCFGGSDGTSVLGDTWLYDHNKTSWTPIATGLSPSLRQNAQCTFFSDFGTALLVGGFSDGAMTPVEDSNLYGFDFVSRQWYITWRLPSETPHRGAGGLHHIRTFDKKESFVELVGGSGVLGVMSDRWIFDVTGFAPPSSTPNKSATSPRYHVDGTTLVPEARAYHNTVQMGIGMLIAFGVASSSLFSDAYYCQYEPSSRNASANDFGNVCRWFLMNVTSLIVPTARFAASGCTNGGNVVYFFGGFTTIDKKQLSNELWSLVVNLSSIGANGNRFYGNWRLMTAAPTASIGAFISVSPRALHGCFQSNNQLTFIGGVVGFDVGVTNSIVTYDLVQQLWFEWQVLNPFKPRAGFSMHFDGLRIYLVGGVSYSPSGVEVLGDVVMLSFGDGGKPFTATATSVSTSQPIYRAFAASSASGEQMILCGGAIQGSPQALLGSTVKQQCALISFDVSTASPYATIAFYKMTRIHWDVTVEAGGLGGGGVLLGEVFVVFGGAIMENQLLREGAFYDVTQTFWLADMLCSREDVLASQSARHRPTACLQCGDGSMNPTAATLASAAALGLPSPGCAFSPPGMYVSPTLMILMPCVQGRYLDSSGASSSYACSACPEGTYSGAEASAQCKPCPLGMTCPLGAVRPLNATNATETAFAQQPSQMPRGKAPPIIFAAVGTIVALLLMVLAFISLMAHRARKARRSCFFDATATAACRVVYERYKRSHFGLDAPSLALSLVDLGAGAIPQDLVVRLLAEHDQDGAGHLTFTAFQDVIIYMIEKALLRPFPGTTEDLMPGKSDSGYLKRKLIAFRFKDLDSYGTDHALVTEGEAIRIHSTLSGGVTRVCFIILTIGVVLALIGQFVFTNISEARTVEPSVGYMSPDGSTNRGIEVPSFEILMTAIGGVQASSQCVSSSPNNDSDAYGPCTGGHVFSISASATGGSYTVTCRYVASTQSCVMKLRGDDFTFPFGASVDVEASFSAEVYAALLNVEVLSDSSIEGQLSQSSITISTQFSGNIFRGFPATTIRFPMLPTVFETVSNLMAQESIVTTGAHVLLATSDRGNEIAPSQLTQYFGVPIKIQFDVSNDILSVKRMPKSTFLDFVSQVLGSITGMGGLLIAVMQLYDSKFIARRHKMLRRELEDATLDGTVDDILQKESLRKMVGFTPSPYHPPTIVKHSTSPKTGDHLDIELLSVQSA